MATIKQGILGGFSGKVGNIVGSSWKGIATVKSLPLSVANPRTVAQTAQRNKMSTMVRFSRLLLAAIIQPYWNPFAQRQSGYNRFVSENIAEVNESGIVTPQNFFITRGSLLGVQSLSATASAGGNSITLTWSNNSGQADALATDETVIAIYNETQDYWITDVSNATRADGTRTVTDNDMVASDQLAVYLGFSRPNISKVSDSAYDGVSVGA